MAINESLEFDIDAPVSLVFGTLADVDALPDWSSASKGRATRAPSLQ